MKDAPERLVETQSHCVEAAARVDLKSSRNMSRKQLRGVLDKLQKRAKDAVVQAQRALNNLDETVQEYSLQRSEYTDFESTLKERVGLVEVWLGLTITGGLGDGKVPEFVPLPTVASAGDKEKADDAATDTRKHGEVLKKTLEELTFLPMESKEVKCFTQLLDDVDRLASATDVKQVEDTTSSVADNQVLIGQLLKSVSVAHGDLRRSLASDQKAVKKATEEKKKKAEEKTRKEQQEKEAAARREVAFAKLAGAFKLKYGDLGHPAVQMHDDEEHLKNDAGDGADSESDPEFLNKPFLLKKSAVLEKIMQQEFQADDRTPAAQLKATITRWEKSFPQSREAGASGKVVAPMLPGMGVDSALEIFSSLKISAATSKLPSFASLSERVLLYGAMKDTVQFGSEPSMLATFRAQYSGVCQVLAMSAAHAARYHKEVCGKHDLSWDMHREALKNVTEAEAKACRAKSIDIFHCTLEPGMLLYLPAGFTYAFSVTSQVDANQAMIKYSFLPDKALKSVQAALKEVAAFEPGPADAKVIGVVQHVISAAVGAATA